MGSLVRLSESHLLCLTLVLLRVTIQTMHLSIAIVVLRYIVGGKLLLTVCARRFDSFIVQTEA